MAILPIHLLGSPVLREPAAEVTAFDDDLKAFVDDLYETMDAASGIGIAANQVGVARRVAVVDVEGTSFAMVNPRLVERSSRKAAAEEGCLSIPELVGSVNRPERVVLEAVDATGAPFRVEAEGLLARAIQHEIDHLDGILFIDHLSALKRQLALRTWRKEQGDLGLTRIPVPEESGPPE